MAGMSLNGRTIGGEALPLFVPEIGANHDGSPGKAERMLRALVEAGAEAVKLQLYTAEELVADPDRVIAWGPPERQRRETIGGLFDRLSLPRPAVADLLALGRELGVLTFATPFSEEGADFLAKHGVPCFKIAASDVGHLPLLRHVAQTGIPVILSLGKCTLGEAALAVETLSANGCTQLGLLHCVAEYPAPIEEMSLRTIEQLRRLFPDAVVGLSDHSIGDTAAIVAVALGAALVEKHVTESRDDEGPDHWFSVEIGEVAALQRRMREAALVLGKPRTGILHCELGERDTSTRSLVTRRPIRAGVPLVEADIKIVRPGTGLAPRLLEAVLGLCPVRDQPANTPLTWECFK
jgi:sialic acid synthase SpsE